MPRRRVTRAQHRICIVDAYACDRSRGEGRLAATLVAVQEVSRRGLQLRYAVLEEPGAEGRTRGGGRTEDELEGSRPVLPCPGAAYQEPGRLSGSGKVVSRLHHVVSR